MVAPDPAPRPAPARSLAAGASLLSLGARELEARVVASGGKPFHARIAREAVLARGVLDYGSMSSLPAELRARLAEALPILAGRETARVESKDGTTKLLVEFAPEGERRASVETVHIPSRTPGRGATLCVSTQAGCPVGCPFCASGQGGLVRNLAAHEIVEQFVRGRALGGIARSVVMGIGEPLLNYANLREALEVVQASFELGARKVTVSTVGFPDRLRRIAPTRPPFQLAISLHTPFDEERDELVPAMRGVPIEEVLAAGDDWFEQTGREVTYEYVLLGGSNDTARHAQRLAERLRGRRCTVNLIPFNPIAEGEYARPGGNEVESFRRRLEEAGLVATVRWSRGVESDAACGQLRARHAG